MLKKSGQTYTFGEIFLNVVGKALTTQNEQSGAMPAGHNGPYYDDETPIRNTSHYLIAFLRAWELSGSDKYRKGAERCLMYLTAENPFRGAYTYHHRTKEGKDLSNGLIGPAWTIEALLLAAQKLGSNSALKCAEELFLLHPFDPEDGLWNRVEPDGTILSKDNTFNHQLWFAATASPLVSSIPEVADRIRGFIDKMPENLGITNRGRILHPVWIKKNRRKERIKRVLKREYRTTMRDKEIGYQLFNLYALAIMKQNEMTLPSLVHSKIQKAIDFLRSGEYLNNIEASKYSFGYNPPGWEIPFVLSEFSSASIDISLSWIQKQIRHSYNPENAELSNRTLDKILHTARIYETARFNDKLMECHVD